MLAPLVISHAACKGHAPENTLAGIRAALRLGVDAIEIDVHATRDGVPVLLHDDTLDRTTNASGRVSDVDLSRLSSVDAGVRVFDGRFQGERVPRLAEVLDMTRAACLLVIEIKQRAIEAEVIATVRAANAAASVMFWSFQPETVSVVRTLAPEIPAAQLVYQMNGEPDAVFNASVRRGAQAVSLYWSTVSRDVVRAARRRGLSVYTWTADAPDEQRAVADCAVDGIVTNVPDVLRRTLKREGYKGVAKKQRADADAAQPA